MTIDWTPIMIALFGSGGLAWGVASLSVKKVAEDVVKKYDDEVLEKRFTTKEQMQVERKELLEEVERRFLSIVAFREFEKRIDEHFKTTDRRFEDSSKRFDKIDGSLEHITELLIKKG